MVLLRQLSLGGDLSRQAIGQRVGLRLRLEIC